MTRTRIRGRQPLGVTTGGGTTGTANPAGSSLTTEAFMLAIIVPDAPAAPSEAGQFALRTTATDAGTAPTDATSALKITNTAAEPVSTPGTSHLTNTKSGAISVAQATGTGWQTIANATGVDDGANATMSSASGLNPVTASGTLTLTYAGPGVSAGRETQIGSILQVAVYFSLTLGTLASGSIAVSYSTDSGANYTAAFTANITQSYPAGGGGVLFDLPAGFTGDQISNLRVRIAGTVTGSAVAAASATFDAAYPIVIYSGA